MHPSFRGLNILQKISMSLMGVLVILTFIGANLQAVFWQSSEWLVSTVLPAVVVKLTNEERAQNSAAPLQRNATLDAAAKLKAEDMAKNEYFSHFSPTGVSPWYWFNEAGYVYAHAGENLAIHFTDSSEVVEAWMNSPLHRQNIVNGIYTEIGVGTAKGKYEGYDTVYVVQLFGTPAIPPTPIEVTPILEPEPEPLLAVAEPSVTEPSEASKTETVAGVEIEETPIVSDVTTGDLPIISEETTVSPMNDIVEEVIEQSALGSAAAEEIIEPYPDTEVVSIDDIETPEEEVVTLANDLIIQEPPVSLSMDEEVVVIQSPTISTSSGLAVANITTPNNGHAGGAMASIATQPNELLQIVYMVLGAIVLTLLSISVVVEVRRLRYEQVAYGLMLLLAMGGLWFINSLLTTGAVIV